MDGSTELNNRFHLLVNEPTKVENCLKYFHEQKQVAEELHTEYIIELKKGEELYLSLDENEKARTTDTYQKFKLEAMQPLLHLHHKLFNTYGKSFKLNEQPEAVKIQYLKIYQELTNDFKNIYEKTPH